MCEKQYLINAVFFKKTNLIMLKLKSSKTIFGLLVEGLTMSLKRKLAVVFATSALALGAVLAVPVAASATGNPSSLDQGDLTLACRAKETTNQYGWTAELYGSDAYSWKCVYLKNPATKKNVDVNNYCMTVFGTWAMTTNPSSPYSWKCQGY